MRHKSATNKAIISLEAGILTVQVKKFPGSTLKSTRRRVRAACKAAQVSLRGDGEIQSHSDWMVPFPPSYEKFVIYEYIERQDEELAPV